MLPQYFICLMCAMYLYEKDPCIAFVCVKHLANPSGMELHTKHHWVMVSLFLCILAGSFKMLCSCTASLYFSDHTSANMPPA